MTEPLNPTAREFPDAYSIRTDAEADRAVEKIQDAIAERDRLVNACRERIAEFEARIEDAQSACERETGYYSGLLYEYFGTVPHKATKTQETYSLPSGKLVWKKESVSIRRDEDALLAWAKANAPQLVETTEKTRWGELKKALTEKDGRYIYAETGEVVPGLMPEEVPGRFEVK